MRNRHPVARSATVGIVGGVAILVVLSLVIYQQHSGISELLLDRSSLASVADTSDLKYVRVAKQQIKSKEALVKQRIKSLKKELLEATREEHTTEQEALKAKRQQKLHRQQKVQMHLEIQKDSMGNVLRLELPEQPPASHSDSSVSTSSLQHKSAANLSHERTERSKPATAPHKGDAKASFFKSLEYFWLSNPGADYRTFVAANKRWDAWYEHQHSSKLAASAEMMKKDKLLRDVPASADKDVLARTQYLVAKYLFLSQHSDASIADWHARTLEYSHHIPQRVRASKWANENEKDDRFSSSILAAVDPSEDKFRAQEHQEERARHMYFQAMSAFVLQRGNPEAESAGPETNNNAKKNNARAEEEWSEVQRLWEALQKERYEQQQEQWREAQAKKLSWEEQRERVLKKQEQQHVAEEEDAHNFAEEQSKQLGDQQAQTVASAANAAAAAAEHRAHVHKQEEEAAHNKKVSEEKPKQPDMTPHGFGVRDAPMGQVVSADDYAYDKQRRALGLTGKQTADFKTERERDEEEAKKQRDPQQSHAFEFVRDFKADLRTHMLRSPRDMLVRAMWLQSLADYAEARVADPQPQLAAAGTANDDARSLLSARVSSVDTPASFGQLSPLEQAWHKQRVVWEGLWREERAMEADQRGIDLARARAIVARVGEGAEAGGGAEEEGREYGDKARFQSLYLLSDASPDTGMLQNYWKSFTERPPSRLPAFGMAQTDSDLTRHIAAAQRAVTRDCGGMGDCEWMHALSSPAHGPQAAITHALHTTLKTTAAASPAGAAGASKGGGKRGGSKEEEEEALLKEVQALLAQKALVKEQVDKLLQQAGASQHAAPATERGPKELKVLKALKAALGDSFERSASVSSVLARADNAAKIAKKLKKRVRAAPSSASAAAGTVLREGLRRRGRRAALTERQLRRGREWASEREREAQVAREQRAGAEQRAEQEQMQEAREGWVYVRKYVAPWDPCSPLPLVSPIQTVREPTSMCNDLSLIRATSAPAQRLGLLSLVESRPATAAWTSESASERTEGAEADASRGGGGGSSRASSLGAFARQMERLNAEQTALNRRRLKLYIKVFGPAYKGEGQAGAAEDDYYHTPSVGAKPETFADSLLALVGLPTSPTTPQNGQPAVSGDTQLQQLLHHFSKAQPDWSRVTKDWDAVGKQAPALLRVSESSFHTILERLRDGESVGSLAADSSASAARVGMSVAGAADARPRTKTRGEIALATALEEEEVKLLAAEEDTLLLRRAAAARALGLRARESV